jgi:hypothetical protein
VRRSFGVIALVLALTGCGDDGERALTGAATTEAGAATHGGESTRLHEVSAAGFSLRLPNDWQPAGSPDALAGALETLGRENPEVERYLRAVVESELIEFFAFDPDVEGNFATNVNVIRFPAEETPSFDEWSARVIAEAERLPTRVGDVEHSREELPAGEALRVEYRNHFRTQGGERTVATLQYVVVGDEHGYVLTFSTLPRQAGAYAKIFRSTAESFRIA